jgi:hypothetical protein
MMVAGKVGSTGQHMTAQHNRMARHAGTMIWNYDETTPLLLWQTNTTNSRMSFRWLVNGVGKVVGACRWLAAVVDDGGRGKFGGVGVEKGDWGDDDNDNNASAPMAGMRGRQQ